jgi:Xaa-Pro aminopeptidase
MQDLRESAHGEMAYPRIPDSEYPLRWARLQEAMAEAGLDLVFAYADDHAVAGPAHARYLADFAPHFEPVCILMPVVGQPILLSGPESETFALQTARLKKVRVIQEFTHPDEEYPFTTLFNLKDILQKATAQIGGQIRRAGLAGLELMPVKVYQALEKALGDAELIDAEGLLTGLRAIKSTAEQNVIRHAYKLAEAGIEAAAAAVRDGVTERSVAAAAEYAMRTLGSEGMGIDTIVASGPNTRPILARAGLRVMQRDELVLLTIAPRYEGYHAAIGYPLATGHLADDVRRAMDVALEAQWAAMKAMQPGRPGSEVEGAARRIIEAAGLGPLFLYSGVHSVGVVEFEPPIFGPNNHSPVEEGMVLSVDVPLFHAPWGGLRYEYGYLVTEGGAEPLISVS